jgi:multicomponent Na+:H+ antiporter subunit D
MQSAMNVLLILPIILPMFTGILALFFRYSLPTQRLVTLIGAGALLGASIALFFDVLRNGIQAAQMGSWPAPYGITLVADLFGFGVHTAACHMTGM